MTGKNPENSYLEHVELPSIPAECRESLQDVVESVRKALDKTRESLESSRPGPVDDIVQQRAWSHEVAVHSGREEVLRDIALLLQIQE
jgi:hypothetical protein